MGKYVRKSKIDGDSIALMDVSSSSSSFGVLTRAKSLALQRLLQKSSSSSPSSSLPTSPAPPSLPSKKKQMITDCGGSYLQLRSRRLPKKPSIVLIRSSKRKKETCVPSSNPHTLDSLACDGSKSASVAESVVCGKEKELNCEINEKLCVETSSGENLLQLEDTERTTRQQEIYTSSGSSTKLHNDNSNQREENLSGSHRHLPTTPEMDEFFSGPEEEQQKLFIDKYNFDPVNEQPLPGRFEWEKVND